MSHLAFTPKSAFQHLLLIYLILPTVTLKLLILIEPFSGNAKDVSVKTIVELIKTVTLNNEDIQHLTDILLNKQSDGSTEWRKKNDPLGVLKKQLQEKEVALEKAMKNLSAAVQKTRELRNELEVEKSRQLNSREKSQQMQIEIQTLHMKLQQSYDSHRNEMTAIQKQLQQMQVKCNEERSHALRLQEDNARLQQLMKNEQHLKHEIEQLRNDRQQFELRIKSGQKNNDELLMKNQQLEARLKSLTDNRQKEESNYQKLIENVKQELQNSESNRRTLVEELTHSSNKCNSMESEGIQLKNRLKEFEDSKNEEINNLVKQLSEVSSERQKLEKALIESREQNQSQNNSQNGDKQELERLSGELAKVLEKTKSLEDSLDIQMKLNEELSEKNRLANETIEAFEQVKRECTQNAMKLSEEANTQLKSQAQDLKLQNESLTTKLNEALDAINSKVKDLESIKSELRVVVPSLDTQTEDWITRIGSNLNEILDKNSNNTSVEQKVEELESLLTAERKRSTELQSKANQFAEALSQTVSFQFSQNSFSTHFNCLSCRN